MYADVIVDITHEKLDKVFQYRVPEELEGDLRTGAGVIVPFGRGNRETKGYIVGFSETCDYDAEKIKDILRTDTSSVAIEARLVALAAWMKEYYGGTMIQDREEAVFFAVEMARQGDILLIAGKGHENYQEIQGVRYPMDDRELVRKAVRLAAQKRQKKEQTECTQTLL